jgi:hypothetical protein
MRLPKFSTEHRMERTSQALRSFEEANHGRLSRALLLPSNSEEDVLTKNCRRVLRSKTKSRAGHRGFLPRKQQRQAGDVFFRPS